MNAFIDIIMLCITGALGIVTIVSAMLFLFKHLNKKDN